MDDAAERLSEPRLLAFYDRLRDRIERAVTRRSRRLGKPVADALLLAPDLFVLLLRLALDREVPAPTRSLIGGALLYFVAPFDLFPEGVVGPVGYLDDAVLAASVLSRALGGELEAYASRYWSGRQELRQTLHDLTTSAHHLLGGQLFARLRRALARRGVTVPASAPTEMAPEGSAGMGAGMGADLAFAVDPAFAGGFEDPGA